jgi:hypothetical protein
VRASEARSVRIHHFIISVEHYLPNQAELRPGQLQTGHTKSPNEAADSSWESSAVYAGANSSLLSGTEAPCQDDGASILANVFANAAQQTFVEGWGTNPASNPLPELLSDPYADPFHEPHPEQEYDPLALPPMPLPQGDVHRDSGADVRVRSVDRGGTMSQPPSPEENWNPFMLQQDSFFCPITHDILRVGCTCLSLARLMVLAWVLWYHVAI